MEIVAEPSLMKTRLSTTYFVPYQHFVVFTMVLCWSLHTTAATTTAGIIGNTMKAAPACLSWRVSGVCFWLVCGFGCKVRTSIRVSNYAPDLVVSTFHDKTTHPWVDFGLPLATTSSGLVKSLLSLPIDSA